MKRRTFVLLAAGFGVGLPHSGRARATAPARGRAGLKSDPDWAGANVTVPYKEKVIAYLDRLEGAAKELRAVNTIVRKGNRLLGYNTDMPGFLADLKRNSMTPAVNPRRTSRR